MKRLRFIAIVLVGLLLGGLAVFIWGEGEPYYDGKALSYWVLQPPAYGGSILRLLETESITAIRTIGTNGLPILVRMVASHDGAIKSKFISLLNSQKLAHVHLYTDNEKQDSATFAFQILGTNALPAVPALSELTRNKYATVRFWALVALLQIHPAKTILLPILTRQLSDSDKRVQNSAAGYLAALYPEEAERLGLYKTFPQLNPAPFINPAKTSSSTNK